MLTVTPSAKDKLKDYLQKEKEGDQVIADNQGERLLLIDQEMADILTELTLDYVETGKGMTLTLISS